jgi:glycogen synthase
MWSAHTLMKQTGLKCSVLNVQPKAPQSDAYISISGGAGLLKELFRHVYDEWTLNVHTNGHNIKSWLTSLVCGFTAQFGPGGTLTLHSGMVPDYLRGGPEWRKTVARFTCLLYDRVVCVNEEIAEELALLGIPRRQIEIKPAFLPVPVSEVIIPDRIDSWMRRHSPLISATLFFRPEYGFELLMEAVSVLRRHYPGLGCLVMGGSDDTVEARRFIEERGLKETVFLAGDVDHELCLALLARSTAFVRPTFRDGDSISVREAISSGIPVVASNVGTRPEGTLLFEAGDVHGLVRQVQKVLSSPPGRQDKTCSTS